MRALSRAALLCVAVVGLAAQLPAAAQQSASPARIHHHPNADTLDARQEGADVSFVVASPPRNAQREGLVSDQVRRYSAFTVRRRFDRFQLFVLDRRTGRTREIRGIPFASRPFSDLVWSDARTLLFDRWSSPHFGVHYAIDVVSGRLRAAVAFHDSTAERQAQPR
jgi:hypothetical protein